MNDVLVPDAKLMRAFSSFVSSSFLALLVDDQPSYKHRVNALNGMHSCHFIHAHAMMMFWSSKYVCLNAQNWITADIKLEGFPMLPTHSAAMP